MDKFSVAGTSKLPGGATKVRFANDITRVKVLMKGGHEEIDLIELPYAMTKPEVINYLMSIDFADGDVNKAAAIQAEAVKRKVELQPAKPAKPAKSKTKAKADEVTASTEAEPAPF